MTPEELLDLITEDEITTEGTVGRNFHNFHEERQRYREHIARRYARRGNHAYIRVARIRDQIMRRQIKRRGIQSPPMDNELDCMLEPVVSGDDDPRPEDLPLGLHIGG
ncbi:hypothetical protein SLS62_001326 [Diatrype stigma]|uniref:Uncharacterized protein n=1 Tax=Diatrype stigma TaxID=117547 RepID=A0AAN9V002_9PEZI